MALIDNFKERLLAISVKSKRMAALMTENLAKDVFRDHPWLLREIEKLNKEQLLDGENSDGTPTGDYAESTKKKRRSRGRQTSHKDYRFTGAFYNSFRARVYKTKGRFVEIDSTLRRSDSYGSSKRDRIVYGSGRTPAAGEKIFGLNPSNQRLIKSQFRPLLLKKLRNELFSR